MGVSIDKFHEKLQPPKKALKLKRKEVVQGKLKGKVPGTQNFSSDQRSTILRYMVTNSKPDLNEKTKLARLTGLTFKQVSQFCVNARRRQLKNPKVIKKLRVEPTETVKARRQQLKKPKVIKKIRDEAKQTDRTLASNDSVSTKRKSEVDPKPIPALRKRFKFIITDDQRTSLPEQFSSLDENTPDTNQYPFNQSKSFGILSDWVPSKYTRQGLSVMFIPDEKLPPKKKRISKMTPVKNLPPKKRQWLWQDDLNNIPKSM